MVRELSTGGGTGDTPAARYPTPSLPAPRRILCLPEADHDDFTYAAGVEVYAVPQRALELFSPAQLAALGRAGLAAARADPAVRLHETQLCEVLPVLEAERGRPSELVAAYAAHAWLHAAWLQDHLTPELQALKASATFKPDADAGATFLPTPVHVAASFGRFNDDGAVQIARAGLASPVTLQALGAATAVGRPSAVSRASFARWSHEPAAPTARAPPPPSRGRAGGDTRCPIAVYLASPYTNGVVDQSTQSFIDRLGYGRPRPELHSRAAHLDASLRDAVSKVDVHQVVHADMIRDQHRAYPCMACAEGWCPIDKYALIAATFTLPFFRSARHGSLRPTSPMYFSPRVVSGAVSAARAKQLELGNGIIAEEYAMGTSRPYVAGEPAIHTYHAFVAMKPFFTPPPEVLARLAEDGQLEADISKKLGAMVTDIIRAAGGKPCVLTGRAFAEGITPHVTKTKARLVHDMRALNKRLAGWHISFATLDELFAAVSLSSYIGLEDWKSGFSNQSSPAENDKYLVYEFGGKYHVKTVAPFGALHEPGNFCLLSAEVCAVAWRRIRADPALVSALAATGVHVDDHYGVALTKESCERVMQIIRESVAGTGGCISPAKSLRPSQRQVVHGLCIDTVKGTISITNDKRYNYVVLMMLVLELDKLGYLVPLDVMRKVVGRNNYVAGVLSGCRIELGPQYEALQQIESSSNSDTGSRAPLTEAAKHSLKIFINALGDTRRGASRLIISPSAAAGPGGMACKGDASGLNNMGFGGVLGPIVIHGAYTRNCPPIEEFNITARELLFYYYLLKMFGHLMAGLTLRVGTDSFNLLSVVGKGSAHDASIKRVLRAVLELADRHKVFLLMDHYFREANTVADDITKSESLEDLADAIRQLSSYVSTVAR